MKIFLKFWFGFMFGILAYYTLIEKSSAWLAANKEYWATIDKLFWPMMYILGTALLAAFATLWWPDDYDNN